jgi:site-specific recombinase XerD
MNPGQSPDHRPAPRLLDRVADATATRHLSQNTRKAYVRWVRRFVLFHHKRHPSEMGVPEVNAFLTHLAVDGHVSASTQNQAICALLFLYGAVLECPLNKLEGVVRAKRPKRLPVVLTPEEVAKVLLHMQGVPLIVALLLYGAGLRLMEVLTLRTKDIDFARNELTIREAKGDKDRVSVLPRRVRWTPVFGRLDKVELRGWEAPYQEQDDGWEATSIWAGIQGEGGSGGRQG